jgi:serine/threonine-protein kinase RsbW
VNDRLDPPPDNGPLGRHEVEVRMLARPERVPGVRALATDMAIREDFDLDSIGDLRLAVEEACAAMLANAEQESTLICRLRVAPSGAELAACVPIPEGREPAVGRASLMILRALSDTVEFWTSRQNDQRMFHVQLAKAVNGR